ncbi:DUF814-domain-containing protein [Tilletiaria anomala UBC 951]|uniref:DUF814-domain-containing protein n=1 Tax=Tilletiaria anomala (strain ATCC 24038 / CBS 436.72 / UBC 951) TaxID=1037660 RepID=A0A066WFC0_TILAU|nr:DUF814-domain-containing protein [Tilletiaria anomala UBC 951]KDN52471.1 DUF814-domain-containing protein [Tilletiaria anomala UBC 951]
MVLFFTSTAVDPAATIYMGKDKVENEDLIKYGDDKDVWVHVDKLSSAHVYIRLSDSMTWDNIPQGLLYDCAQLVKANSIEGNKKNNVTVIYTPWTNIKKTGDMAIGAVTFHNEQMVKRIHVKERENAIVNRLNKTKREVAVDHEAVRQERERERGREKKAAATEARNAQLVAQRAYAADKEARDYSKLFSPEALAAANEEKERKAKLKALHAADGEVAPEGEKDDAGGNDSDDSFM